jgi:hypothetical protein
MFRTSASSVSIVNQAGCTTFFRVVIRNGHGHRRRFELRHAREAIRLFAGNGCLADTSSLGEYHADPSLLSTGSLQRASQARKFPYAGRSLHKLARPSGNWIRRGDARKPRKYHSIRCFVMVGTADSSLPGHSLVALHQKGLELRCCRLQKQEIRSI